ncbi:hypothetical protein EUGRSUZ_A02049 [Eucalyptus grandis]|uniref:Uncharacterized protein n=2 Tax=Eucalyptus grandis TaxID=71139 RepID=A0ACC3M589_EUCGR|nr:hypothetical protein EUGRSUZ_A02049 [Eucalyptus grandis]
MEQCSRYEWFPGGRLQIFVLRPAQLNLAQPWQCKRLNDCSKQFCNKILPKHYRRSNRKLEVRPNSCESSNRQASPGFLARGAQDNVKSVEEDENPPREAQSQGRP